MKRIISLCIILMMITCSSVFAAGQKQIATCDSVEGFEQLRIKSMNQEQEQKMIQTMNMIQERSRERLQQLEGLLIEEEDTTGEIIATGVKDAKFLHLFKVSKSYTFIISEDGEIEQRKGFLEGLIWSEI